MPNPVSSTTKQAAFAALAASNDLLIDEIERQQQLHFNRIFELQKAFRMRAPTATELAQVNDETMELEKLRVRKDEIVLLEFAALDSSADVANLIGAVRQINKALQAEKKAVAAIVQKVQNVEKLIKNVDAVLKNLLTLATLFA
jgi:hypothetical protein